MTEPILEACVDSLEGAILAANNGAHQIELCSRLDLDGLTPDIKLVEAVISSVNIPIKVMLRNRGGDFCYDTAEIEAMKISLLRLLQLNVQGIVFGALNVDNTINVNITQEICALTNGIPVTFHKAIDSCPDIIKAVSQLKKTDVQFILSSGGKDTASYGAQMIKNMISTAGNSMTIIAAGGITSQNLYGLHKLIQGRYYHGKKIVSL